MEVCERDDLRRQYPTARLSGSSLVRPGLGRPPAAGRSHRHVARDPLAPADRPHHPRAGRDQPAEAEGLVVIGHRPCRYGVAPATTCGTAARMNPAPCEEEVRCAQGHDGCTERRCSAADMADRRRRRRVGQGRLGSLGAAGSPCARGARRHRRDAAAPLRRRRRRAPRDRSPGRGRLAGRLAWPPAPSQSRGPAGRERPRPQPRCTQSEIATRTTPADPRYGAWYRSR